MSEQTIIGFDYNLPSANGTDNITSALLDLLNDFPSLPDGDEIIFSMLSADSGKAMFPTSSVAIADETEDITGHVTQTCIYPFLVIFRSKGYNSETRKANVKELLDDLGRWLEKQEVDGEKLTEYPALLGDREFLKITRSSQSYLYGTSEDKTEDWAISIKATYRNEFDR